MFVLFLDSRKLVEKLPRICLRNCRLKKDIRRKILSPNERAILIFRGKKSDEEKKVIEGSNFFFPPSQSVFLNFFWGVEKQIKYEKNSVLFIETIVNYWLSVRELICVTTDVYFDYKNPPRLRLVSLCIHKGIPFVYGQILYWELQ